MIVKPQVMSLITGSGLCQISPLGYLHNVLDRVCGDPVSRPEKLPSSGWIRLVLWLT